MLPIVHLHLRRRIAIRLRLNCIRRPFQIQLAFCKIRLDDPWHVHANPWLPRAT